MSADDEIEIRVHEPGKPVETLTLKGPAIASTKKALADFHAKNPNFWCKCGNPEAAQFIEVRHSLDVICRCGGYMQVG